MIYLGGLYPRSAGHLSPHLQSRREVGEILMGECGAMVVRAGITIGRGSAAFEIMRILVIHLPIMITPYGCTADASQSTPATRLTRWRAPVKCPPVAKSTWPVPMW